MNWLVLVLQFISILVLVNQNGLLRNILRKEHKLMGQNEDLAAAVAKCDTAVESMLTYLKSLPAGTTVADAIAHITSDADMLNGAIPANLTPPTPTPPSP